MTQLPADPQPQSVTGPMRVVVMALQRLVLGFTAHWLLMLNGFLTLYLGGALLAPVLMETEHPLAADIVYTLYGVTCHQLPHRSYFFFGTSGVLFGTYERETVVEHGADPRNELTLRRFRGAPELGYKAGLCQRDLSLYTGALVGGLLYGGARRRRQIAPIPVWLLALFTLPMALDGTTHLIDEVTGLGFRATNGWAVALTRGALGPEFYTGATLGTLNWLLRNLTGLLFGVGIVLWAYPLIARGFEDVGRGGGSGSTQRPSHPRG